jgi:serine protease Do
MRDGKTFTAALPLEAPSETPARGEVPLEGRHPLSGCVIANLSPAVSEELNLPGAWDGVVILRVARRGTAGQLGFRPGDIVYSINGETFDSSAAMGARLEGGGQSRSWEIKFVRDGKLHTVSFH